MKLPKFKEKEVLLNLGNLKTDGSGILRKNR